MAKKGSAAGYAPLEQEDEAEEDAALLPTATAAAPAPPQAPPSVLAEIGPALRLGMPMIVSQYLDRSAQQISVMMIGHIGPEELGAVVLATM